MNKKIRLMSLFSGIGAFEKALDNLDVDYELVNFCEFDKYAVKSYCAIHNVDESKNLGDITKVDETELSKDIDILTYGFPCQDISSAGKQKGLFNEDGTLTRSGLFFDALRIIEHCQPKIAIAENVKNLVSKKFKAQFQVVLESLDCVGYNNYYAVLNAKDFGIPQNRERVFIVSVRKDVDTGVFEFPKPFPLKRRLKDVLEEVVVEKYYLTQEMVDRLFTTSYQQNKYENRVTEEDGVVGTLCARDYKDPKCVQLGQIYPNSGNPQAGRVYDADGISPTMDTCSGGNRSPKVLVCEPLIARCVGGIGEKKSNGGQQWYQQNRIYQGDVALAHLASIPGGSYHYVVEEPVAVWDGFNQRVRADSTVVGTLTQNCGADLKRNGQCIIEPSLRIRKLTPKECFRLMGFDDESFHKAEAVNSNTQLYKQAGNSIVVDVLEHLLLNVLKVLNYREVTYDKR
jgi:DNA (cytosine-5)-methyltransferase 1